MSYIYFKIKKKFEMILFYILFYNFCISEIKSECLSRNMTTIKYPNMNSLDNENNLLISSEGISIYNKDLTIKYYHYNFPNNITIENAKDISQTKIVQFSEGEKYVLCLVKNYIFILNQNGELYYSDNISESLKNEISLVPYKYVDNKYYFILAYLNEGIKFLYYNFEIVGNNANLSPLTNKFYKPKIDNIERGLFSESLSCEILYLNSDKTLTCFVNVRDIYLFSSYTFNPDEEFNILLPSINISSGGGKEIKYLSSATDKNKKNALVCYSSSNGYIECIIYNIENNKFIFTEFKINHCSANSGGIHTYYYEKNEEFIASCISNGNYYSLIIINEDLSQIKKSMEEIHLNDCWGISAFSIIPSNVKGEYSFLAESNCKKGEYVRQYIMTENEENCIKYDEEIKDSSSASSATNEPKITIPIPTTSLKENSSTILNNSEILSKYPEKCSEKCSECDSKSENDDMCIKCNNDNYYYPIKKEFDSLQKGEINYIKCFNEETKPNNYFFNKNNKYYEPCFDSCYNCTELGDNLDNKCLSCDFNFIRNEDYPEKNNCVYKCDYYYYYDKYNEYKCTTINYCPEEYYLLVKNKKKCIDNCQKDNIYKLQYNGECVINCPYNTIKNDSTFICEYQKNKCSLSNKEMQINSENEIETYIDKMVKAYAQEFLYTNTHITNYKSKYIDMILYKNIECINELELNIPQIDFSSCFEKLKNSDKNINLEYLIVAVVEVLTGENPQTTYALFDSITGERINTKICKDAVIEIKENVFRHLSDNATAIFLAKQNINVFNLSDSFFTDICIQYISPNGKDATLQDRILQYHPNVTLCDEGCTNKGVNLTSFLAICECKYKELFDKIEFDFFKGNIIISEFIDNVKEIAQAINLEVLSCYKTVFDIKYFKKCIGGFIFFGLIFLQILFTIIYFCSGINEPIVFINHLCNDYIAFYENLADDANNLNKSGISINDKADKLNIDKKKKINDLIKKNEPPRKLSKKMKYKVKSSLKDNSSIPDYSFNKKSNSIYLLKSASKDLLSKNSSTKLNKFDETKNIKIKGKKKRVLKRKTVVPHSKMLQYLKKQPTRLTNINLEEYLEQPFEEMEFEDVLIKDKRTFCQFFGEKILETQMIINYFFVKDNIFPKSLKTILFIVRLVLCFSINGLFFNEQYISSVFNNTEEEKFFSFVERSINRFIYTYLSGGIISFFIECFFIEEKKIKKILIRQKSCPFKAKHELFIIIQKIKVRNRNFIILSYFITILSWFYVSCFNNVYNYTQKEWIISSIFFFILIQFSYFIYSFIETVIRFLSFKCKSENIYELSTIFT